MAKVIVNLSDTMDSFVTKTNLISTYVGDLTTLNTTEDSDLVGAINEIYGLIDSDTDFRSKISVTDAGGDGSLSYNSSTGVITYTGPSATEVRAHISVTDAGGDGSLSYNSTSGVLTYTGPSASEVRAHISAGEGIDFASGVISGEDATTANKGIASFSSTNFSVSSGAVSIKALGVAESNLVDGSVSTNKLADDAVSRAKLKDEVGLVIYNSSGSALKTLYGAGS